MSDDDSNRPAAWTPCPEWCVHDHRTADENDFHLSAARSLPGGWSLQLNDDNVANPRFAVIVYDGSGYDGIRVAPADLAAIGQAMIEEGERIS